MEEEKVPEEPVEENLEEDVTDELFGVSQSKGLEKLPINATNRNNIALIDKRCKQLQRSNSQDINGHGRPMGFFKKAH